MKIIKNLFSLAILFMGTFMCAQLRVNNTNFGGKPLSMAFLDASSYPTYNGYNGLGSGLIFPRTDLTAINSDSDIFDEGAIGTSINNPNYYDSMIVFNTGVGALPSGGMGTSNSDLSVGFYYYRNTGDSWNSGVWTPLGGEGSSSKVHITENTATETNLVTATTAMEKVISITGTADGVTTHMDLGTNVLPKDTVVNFRKAIICDSTGKQVLVATGSYNSATNKFVTGNGMMNYCLPAANDYKVELYFTSN